MFDKVVLVTRKTRLQGLVERFNTRAQARFYLEHAGLDFDDYQREDDTYRRAVDQVQTAISLGLKVQCLERTLVPTFMFSDRDVVLAIGQDGLVANTAKYAAAQPLMGINPDPSRFDGVLLPFAVNQVRAGLASVLDGRAHTQSVTLAQATLNDGQRLLAFNDLFVGSQSHVSAHYRVRLAGSIERQSSSGLIISTGAGSTGWLSSVFAMARALCAHAGVAVPDAVRMSREDPRLFFTVREPFESQQTSAVHTVGFIEPRATLQIESLMPSGGVIFSDGVESDFLAFNSGAVVTVGAAQQRAHLVLPTA